MRWILKELHNFSSQERRSFYLILILIFSGLFIRFWLLSREPEPLVLSEQQKKEIEDFVATLKSVESNKVSMEKIPPNNIKRDILYFYFDPNHASESDLQELGLHDFVIKNIMKYRKAGGEFKSPDEFRKIYGLSNNEFERISPWIKLQEEEPSSIESLTAEADNPDLETETEIKMEINTVAFGDLMKIQGMSAEIAGRIIKYRELLGGYYSLHQLREVYGMEDSLLKNIEELSIVKPEFIKRLALKDVEYKQLLRHPYLDQDQVNQIFQLKEFYGDSITLGHIIKNRIIDDSLIIQLSPYIEH